MIKATTLYYLLFFLGGILLSTTACKSVKEDNDLSPTSAGISAAYVNETPEQQDCYYPRKTIRSFENQLGTILFFSNEYVITVDSPDTRYMPCEMPSAYQQDGLQVLLSGDKLEIFPQERRFALPLRLKSMELAKVDKTKQQDR